MAEAATMDVVEALRDEMRDEVKSLRRQIDELGRRVDATARASRGVPATAGSKPRPRAERLASLARVRALREAILRDRGGEPLPSSADEIRQMRDERTAQILGERDR